MDHLMMRFADFEGEVKFDLLQLTFAVSLYHGIGFLKLNNI